MVFTKKKRNKGRKRMKKFLLIILISTSILSASSLNLGMKYFIKGHYNKALPHFIKASNSGNKQAQFYLANMYEKGLGVKKDKKMASKLYKLYANNSKVKTSIQSKAKVNAKKVYKKKMIKKKVIRKVKKKKINLPKSANGKAYSKRLKKFFNPDLQGAEEVTFD